MSDLLRNFALLLLNDDNGINEESWNALQMLFAEEGIGSNEDIIDSVRIQDGRVYLPEEFFDRTN